MKVTWVIMTHANKCADLSVKYNLAVAGDKVDEIIWVDNGSIKPSEYLAKIADRIIKNKTNLGVAKGYNPAFALASGDYIVITGSDTKMPKNWLKVFKEYCEKIPNTGVASMCSVDYNQVKERILGNKQVINGLEIVPFLPMGFRIINKQILSECGYLREDFGLYGWDDVEWAYRIRQHTKLLLYVIPGYIPVHDAFGKQEEGYTKFKQEEVAKATKSQLLAECAKNNYPKYNPYV